VNEPKDAELSTKVLRGMGWNLLGTLSVALFAFVYSIVIARLLHSDDYGKLTLLVTLAGTLVLLTSFGFESTINRFVPEYRVKKEFGKIKSLLRKLLLIRLVVISVISIILFFGSDFIATTVFSKPELGVYIRVLAVIVLPYGFEGIFRSLLVSYYDLKYVNIAILIARTVNFTLAFSLFYAFGEDLMGPIVADLITWTFLMAVYALKAFLTTKKPKAESIDLARVIRYSGFLYIFTVTNFIIMQQMDVILLGVFWESKIAGFYFLGYNLAYFSANFFAVVLLGGIALSFYSELYAKKDFSSLKKAYSANFEFIYITMIPISVGGIVLARDLIGMLYGPEYFDVVAILIMFFISFNLTKVSSITATYLSAMDKESKLLKSRAIFGATNVVLNLILIPQYGALGAVVGTAIAGILMTVYESYLVHKLVKPDYPVSFVGKVVLASLVMGALVFILHEYVTPFLPFLILIGLLVYVGIAYVLKPITSEVVEIVEKADVPFKRFVTYFARRPHRPGGLA
jgi:stage V sporulation protein B